MGKKLSGKDLIKLGFPKNNSINVTLGQINRYQKRVKKEQILIEAKKVLLNPEAYKGDGVWGKIAESLLDPVQVKKHALRTTRAPFQIYGETDIDEQAKYQLFDALKLPVATAGALMPDAHAGYGLPIGGVLATKNAVIPYGVGVDIGCRMCLTIYPIATSYLKGKKQQLQNILIEHTKFGMYETHKVKHDHEIFERIEFKEIPLVKRLKDKAYKQLGTSGGGNHFVEFGIVTITETANEWGLPIGEYLGVLSHSGSRGLGANITKHYTYLATKQCPLPKHVQQLAWLDLNTHDGQEYWLAMNLAGDYAQACHDDIHARIAKLLGARAVAKIENHHNFAWKQEVNGEECIVHRKGATPAAKGELGIIPGSMTAPGFIVRGLGNTESLESASHGAGRLLSRRKCKETLTQSEIKKQLKAHEVTLIGGGVDEAPMAYKDIHKVMSNQKELVEVVGTFIPKIVRMDK
ncbi:RtcB family protein [Aquimarina algicola]|uniref:3'-phosphate/5'-hydroxy nucleic acid ligase n=1 Tax=Aquimarina algicola TaxID=2589995 RepID=A0A504JES0_9FLAO|nr:RtcB family protein [Aquimarina algicola]TPN86945.1 RtcB family protein [Aquimarina algicola]